MNTTDTIATLDRMVATLNLWADQSWREYESGNADARLDWDKHGALADKAQDVRDWLANNARVLD